jgi:hypothetical protein
METVKRPYSQPKLETDTTEQDLIDQDTTKNE